MPEEIYEVVAQGARYWFLFLMALIAWRSWRWYRRDRRQRKKRMRLLPDAGFVGEMVVIEGGGALKAGAALPVPREGTLGALRTNDLCVPAPGVRKRHLWFRFEDGKGLMVEPIGKNAAEVDGEPFGSHRKPLYMGHGSRLWVGEAELRLRLFAGFEAVAPVRQARPFGDEPPPEAAQWPAQPDADAAGPWGAPPQPGSPPAAQQWAMQQQMMQQQMMQQYAQQQAYMQWLQQQQAMQAAQQQAMQPPSAPEPEEDPLVFEKEEGVFAHPAAFGEVGDASAYMRPGPILPPSTAEPASAGERNCARQPEAPVKGRGGYHPPASTEAPAAPEDWPYAPNPCADEPEDEPQDMFNDEPAFEDEDMTDAPAPPRSAYTGHDEAERAKKRVWDKYLGGGRGR